MAGSTLVLCSFLVLLVAVERCHGSRSDVRQQLRSEVVYSERNHKEGRYKYGYAVKKGETQFHHQRSLDGAMYGCYGYVDPQGKLFITHYLADKAGYRLVNMANPDRKLAERIRNLGTAENPVDLQHLFPAECQEDGDIKTLQETADAMKASLAESGHASTDRGSLSSVKATSQSIQHHQGFSSASGTVAKTLTSQSSGDRSVSTVGSSEGQDSKVKGSFDMAKNTVYHAVEEVKSNQLQTGQQNQVTFKETSFEQASIGGSHQGKTNVGALAVAEPKFVMKSYPKDSPVRIAASDSSRFPTFKKASEEQKVVEGSKTELKISAEKSKLVESDDVDQKLHDVSTGTSVLKQTTGEQQLNRNSNRSTSPMESDEFSGSLKTPVGSDFMKSTQNIASTSAFEGNKKTSVAFKVSSNEGMIAQSDLTVTKVGESTKTLQADRSAVDDSMLTYEIKDNLEKQITGDLHSNKGTAVVEKATESLEYFKESESAKGTVKQQTSGSSTTVEKTGTRIAETKKTMQSDTYRANENLIGLVQIVDDNANVQIAGKHLSADTSLKGLTKSMEKTEESKSVENSPTLKISESDRLATKKMNVAKISEKQETIKTSTTLNTASVGESTGNQLGTSSAEKGAKIGLLGEVDQVVKHVQDDHVDREKSVEDNEFLNIKQTAKSEQISSVKNNVASSRFSQSSVESNTSEIKGDVTIYSSKGITKEGSTTVVSKSELDRGTMKYSDLNKGNLLKTDSLESGSAEQKYKQTTSMKNIESISSRNDGFMPVSQHTKAESQFGTSAFANKADASISSSKATEKVSPKTVGQLEQTNLMDSEKAGLIFKEKVTSDSKAASQTTKNVQGLSIKAAATISEESNASAVSNAMSNKDTISGRSSSTAYRGTVKYSDYATENKQPTDLNKEIAGHGIAEVKRKIQRSKAGVQRETQTSFEQNGAKNLQGGQRKAESAEASANHSRKGAVTIAEYIKDSMAADAFEQMTVKDATQAGSVKQSTDMSTKQEVILANSSQKEESEIEYSTKAVQAVVKDSMVKKLFSGVTELKQDSQQSEVVLTKQNSMDEQTHGSNKQHVEVFADQMQNNGNVGEASSGVTELKQDFKQSEVAKTKQMSMTKYVEVSAEQNKGKDRMVEKELSSVRGLKKDSNQSKVVQTQHASELSSGRSFNQAKSEQIVQQVKEISKDSAPIIRFAIPGIIQQGPPIQGRRNFVGIPNLNDLFPTNSQSRVGAVPVSEEDDPRLEIPRVPATPRTTTSASPDAVTVSYQLSSGTDRVPVAPRPTTSLRPISPGFPATTVKSLVSRTTIGPSGDIYDEIEEEIDLGSRPTLMSPQVPEQKPPSTSSGGVTVIPSISQGVLVEQSGLPHCQEVTLQIPSDAKQIFVRTNSPEFRVFGDGDPNERIRLVEPGVYEVNLGATSGIQFNRYQAGEDPWKRSNKLQLDLDRSIDYGELVQKPLYSRTHSGQHSTATGGGVNQARMNNPYLPLAPTAPVAPVEARNAGGSAEQVLTPEQRSLLSLVPSWKKVLLYY